jgi:serine/threonine-protein kinase ULK/ATG1
VKQQGSPSHYPPPLPARTTPPSPGPAFPQSLSGNGTSGRSASNALSRALNIASKKLFGGEGSKDQVHPSSYGSGRRQISADFTREEPERTKEDDSSDALLKQLEDLAQKTAVLMRWCDDLFGKLSQTPASPGRTLRRTAVPEPDCSPVTCITLYMLLMSFAQRGVDSIRQWSDYLKRGGEVGLSDGFSEGTVAIRNTTWIVI